MWNPPIALTPEEQKIAARTRKTRKFFVFLRERRHELLDADFQHTLAQSYSPEPTGKAPVEVGRLALALLLQAYGNVGDRDAVELTVMDKRWQMVLACLVLQLYFWTCSPFVVPVLGDALMPAAPRRPGQYPFHFLLRGQHQTPEETPNLADTQRHTSHRIALKAAKLLGLGDSHVFWGSSGGRWAARRTVNSAYAHMASVIWRYHPVQLRTSY